MGVAPEAKARQGGGQKRSASHFGDWTAARRCSYRHAVSSEPVSGAKFPASRENTGNFIDSELSGASTRAKKALNSVPYEPIPYASEQGIF
jgi:hypothetical protein